jgi:hypothetical protein
MRINRKIPQSGTVKTPSPQTGKYGILKKFSICASVKKGAKSHLVTHFNLF